MDSIGQYAVAALTTASIYALISMGVTLMYGVARVLNVANATMFTLAALLTVELDTRGVPFVVAGAISVVAVTLLGLVTYALFFRRVLQRPFTALIISLGLVVVMQAMLVSVWELDVYRLSGGLSVAMSVGPVTTTIGSVLTLGVASIVTLLLYVLLQRTSTGREMRAVSEDTPTAILLGVDSRRVTVGMFAVGTAMAAIAGVLVVTFIPISATASSAYGIKTFGIAIVGGLGSPVGALVASVLLAVAETVPIAFGYAHWSPSFLYAALVVILLVRPEGLFGIRGQHRGFSGGTEPPPVPVYASDFSRRVRRGGPVVGLLAGAAFLPLYFGGQSGTLSLAVYAISLALLAYSVWVPLHFIGVPSIGHAAIWGFSAYASLVLANALGTGNPLIMMSVAIPVGVVTALVVGLVAMRVQGLVAAASITLAMGGLGVNALANMRTITGGTMGASFTTDLELFGFSFGLRQTNLVLFGIGVVLLIATTATLTRFRKSASGAKLYAVRDSAMLATSLGISTYWTKVWAFTASGAVAGVSAVLYVQSNRYLEPSLFNDLVAINVLLAIIIGGSVSLYGPLIGTVLLVFVPHVLPFSGDMNRFWYGMIVVVIATAMPTGITGKWRETLLGLQQRGNDSTDDPDPWDSQSVGRSAPVQAAAEEVVS